MVVKVILVSGLVFMLVWFSTLNFQGRVDRGVNTTLWLEKIKEEMYKRIRLELLFEEKADEMQDEVGDHDKSPVQVSLEKFGNVSFDAGRKTSDGEDIVEDETNDIGGERKLEFNLREDSGSWKQRQERRVRRLRNVCSRHPERTSFIESEMRR